MITIKFLPLFRYNNDIQMLSLLFIDGAVLVFVFRRKGNVYKQILGQPIYQGEGESSRCEIIIIAVEKMFLAAKLGHL